MLVGFEALDRPVAEQYWNFVAGLAHFELGNSLWQDRPAADIILERMPLTLALVAAAIGLTAAIGLPFGIAAALKPGGLLVIADHSARAGDGIAVGKTLHRIEESALRREIEAAGFKLVAEGDFLRRPEDSRDFSSTRPTGPVDEFVLKFQKPN